MATEQKLPLIGVGVIIVKEGKVLIGKRKGSHAQKYSIPGGKLELGQSFEEAAIREIKEETNIDIKNPKVIGLTNNLNTYKEEGFHSISVILFTDQFKGEPEIMEPQKCEEWLWVNPNNLPQPHFDASERGIKLYLDREFY